MGDTSGERRQQVPGSAPRDESANGWRAEGNHVIASAGENFWSELLWLPCRDGKARPTQSGLQPLAHGVPNRVGTLRGAGNAIVPQVAAAFVMAALDLWGTSCRDG